MGRSVLPRPQVGQSFPAPTRGFSTTSRRVACGGLSRPAGCEVFTFARATIAAAARPRRYLASPMNVGFLIRISSSALAFSAMAGWHFLAPRRARAVGRRPRLPSNLGILIVDVLAPGT